MLKGTKSEQRAISVRNQSKDTTDFNGLWCLCLLSEIGAAIRTLHFQEFSRIGRLLHERQIWGQVEAVLSIWENKADNTF